MVFIITMLVSIVAALFILLMLGVPFHVTLACIGSFLGIWYLMKEVIEKIRAKTLPVKAEWAQYVFVLVAIILYGAGMYYKSLYTVIFSCIAVLGFVVSYYIENKKV